MSETATSLNTRRYWKHIEGAKKARVKERTAQQACSEALMEAYRDLDDGELLTSRCAELGVRDSDGHRAKYAVLKADTGFHVDTIRRALALEVIVETVSDSSPHGAEMSIGVRAADKITHGLPMDELAVGKHKKELKRRIKTAQQIAKEDGRTAINESDAKFARGKVTEARSYKKQAEVLSVALGIVHALEQINETAAEMSAVRAVHIIKSHEDTCDDFFKEWEKAYTYLCEIEQLL